MSEPHDGAADAASEGLHDAHIDDVQNEASAADHLAKTGDDAAAAAEDGEGDKPKPRQTAQERIDELTRDKHAERRAREAAERELERLRGPKEPKAEAPAEDAEPDPAKFQYGETDPGYIKALARFEGRQAYREEAAKDRQQQQARTVEQTWDERQKAFAKDNADYFKVLDREWDCSQPMADAIRTSEAGAAVAYHLASNPEEARRIAALNPLAAIREIGRIEARLEKSPGAPGKPASDAPPPPAQVRGGGGRFAISPATTDFAAFEKMVDAKP